MKKIMGMCENRHPIKDVSEYIFPEKINPLDIELLNTLVHEKLGECDNLVLYVTGIYVALVAVINYCCRNHIALKLMHYDKISDSYYPQYVCTQRDCDLLKEGGYMHNSVELFSKCM